MKSLHLTEKEQKWLKRFKRTMAAAPASLEEKISCYTIGDHDITLYDKIKFDNFFNGEEPPKDQCQLVEMSESEIGCIDFPFRVESTAG